MGVNKDTTPITPARSLSHQPPITESRQQPIRSRSTTEDKQITYEIVNMKRTMG